MNILTSEVDYQVGDITHRGFVAFNDLTSPPRTGVMVIHEWWGLNDYIKNRAKKLAELGYVAFAIDMFGEGKVAGDPDEAASLMNAVLGDMDSGTKALQAGYQALVDQPQVDAERTAAIGYCFGGAMALHMARIGLPLSAVVSFHGALGSFHTATPGSIRPRVLVCHGEEDSMVTMDDVAGFKQEMDTAQADYQVNLYPNAKHGFTNEAADENGQKYGLDLGYNALADNKSWDAMETLFDEVF
ncbi:MAG: dienelactone hydrolase family protein [Gammaproteobacteria bacterium]